jgi:nitrite reductase/ring-hydroxylating ferredoxin subunit
MNEVFVSESSGISDGQMKLLEFETYEIGVYRHQGKLYAYRSQCPHQGGPACEGMIIGKVCDLFGENKTFIAQTFDENDMRIVCPWHGWEFHMTSGRNAADPAFGLKSYKVFEKEGAIYVVV